MMAQRFAFWHNRKKLNEVLRKLNYFCVHTNVALPDADGKIDDVIGNSELVGVNFKLSEVSSRPRSSHSFLIWFSLFVCRVWSPPVSTSLSRRCPKSKSILSQFPLLIELLSQEIWVIVINFSFLSYPIWNVSTVTARKLQVRRLRFC